MEQYGLNIPVYRIMERYVWERKPTSSSQSY